MPNPVLWRHHMGYSEWNLRPDCAWSKFDRNLSVDCWVEIVRCSHIDYHLAVLLQTNVGHFATVNRLWELCLRWTLITFCTLSFCFYFVLNPFFRKFLLSLSLSKTNNFIAIRSLIHCFMIYSSDRWQLLFSFQCFSSTRLYILKWLLMFSSKLHTEELATVGRAMCSAEYKILWKYFNV